MTKKVIALVLALVMILACTVSAMAMSDTAGSEAQGAIANAPTDYDGMTVYLTIESSKIGSYAIARYGYPVVMTASDYSNGVCFVGDVLRKAASTYSWLNFYSAQGYLPNGPSDYVYGIADTAVNSGNTIFAPVLSISSLNGWRFRINGKYRLLDSADWPAAGPDFDPAYDYPVGAAIEEAYVKDGDHIQLYFADTNSNGVPTKKIVVDGYGCNNTTLGLVLYQSTDYYTEHSRIYTPPVGEPYEVPYWTWTITNYTQMTSCSKTITVKVDGVSKTGTFNNAGNLIISNLSLLPGSGTHTVEVMPTYQQYYRNGVYYYIPYTTGFYFEFTR